MKINGKAHCLFEQSGTFKKEFIKLGIAAEDYEFWRNRPRRGYFRRHRKGIR